MLDYNKRDYLYSTEKNKETGCNSDMESTSSTESTTICEQNREAILPLSHITVRLQSMEETLSDSEKSKQHEALLVNTRALPKSAMTYELEKFEKKVLIIFNQKVIDNQGIRHGSDKDVEALKMAFMPFEFRIVVHTDLRKDELFSCIKSFTKQDFTDYGCIAVAILTHGDSNGLLWARDQAYRETDFIQHFTVRNNQTLLTKPKIFMIEACRGKNLSPGIPVFRLQSGRRNPDATTDHYHLPVEADMLVLHSSYAGSVSYRDIHHGSWFIQTLCSKIISLGETQHLENIILEVKRDIAINKYHEQYNTRTREMEINKQMPVITSTLLRKLHLRRYAMTSIKPNTFVNISKREVTNSETQANKKEPRLHDDQNMSTVVQSIKASSPISVSTEIYLCKDDFEYMKNTLKMYIEKNPHDEIAINFWDVANTFKDSVAFKATKEKMSAMISNHLLNQGQNFHIKI